MSTTSTDTKPTLTDAEWSQIGLWRKIARTYRHGGCGREHHRAIGCDIVCLYAHGTDDHSLREPWHPSYQRHTTEANNAVVDRLCDEIMSAIPKVRASA
jgi:hypothetical protein